MGLLDIIIFMRDILDIPPIFFLTSFFIGNK